MARAILWGLTFVAVLALAGCGKDDIATLDSGGGITVTVDQSKSTTAPTYSWTGGNVDVLVVFDSTAAPVWDVLSTVPGTDSVPSPYTHGDAAPPNTGLNAYTLSLGKTPANPLTSGSYFVTVERADTTSGSAAFFVP